MLSFYEEARSDPRFREAYRLLQAKLVDGKMVVENPNRQLTKIAFCFKGQPSDIATKRFKELVKNL